MAISGVNVEFGTAGTVNASESLPRPPLVSQLVASGSVSSVSAPINGIVTLYASAESYVVIGPDAAAGSPPLPASRRIVIPATTRVQYLCNKGDLVAVAAS